MDEAYGEFSNSPSYPNTLDYLSSEFNIITLRTFSKLYGLAGLRIGYGVAKGELVSYLEKVRQPFNVNALAQVAAFAALDDEEHVKKTLENNSRGLAYLYKELKRLGLEYIPTQANFFLIDLKRNAEDLYNRLLREGVIVRPMGGYGLKNYIRVTVGLPEENKRFIQALKKVLNKS